MAVHNIHISGNFDGGNPKDPDSIIRTGQNSFTIIPFSEDNDPNYKFRLDVRAINRSSVTQKLHFFIDWQEPKFNYLRNYVFLKNEKDFYWTYLPMAVSNTQTLGEINLVPGETYLCLHPKYSYEDYLKFILRIPETKFISKIKLGTTLENREVWLVNISDKRVEPKKKIILVSRIHPYETSGSYCAEGIVDYFLNTNSESPCDMLRDTAIFLVPMANPDGVYNGLCKLTAPGGIDLSKQMDLNDPNSALLAKSMDTVRPDVYCEFHNWMFQELDGIYFLNWTQAKRFVKNFPSQEQYKKKGKVNLEKSFFSTA